MAAVPPCGLGCRIKKGYKWLESNKKPFLIISIFILLAIEIGSKFLRYEQNYACYIYPLLTQIQLFVIVFSIYLWNERLRFCLMKIISTLFLSMYYLFGIISIVFQFTDSFYESTISNGLLIISCLCFSLSAFNISEKIK